MAEKSLKQPFVIGVKPVPMKLFATWEVDRTPPNCMPRLCSLTLTRLIVVSPLGSDLTSLIVAVKMQSSKRTLRSNDISVPPNGLLDTELDLTFSLQYPHFLKRGGNYLQIMLQRRKRYKNRPILGFKTLAVGVIDMDQVLQRSQDKELELFSENKEKSAVMAKILMFALSSQPVDHEEGERHKRALAAEHSDRVADGDTYSDEEEEFTSNDEGSDSEPMMDDTLGMPAVLPRKPGSRKLLPPAARQKNFKQKFIALLKKFKVTDEALDSEQDHEELEQKLEQEMDPQEIEDLFDEIDDLSESGPEMDNMSVSSTPKPSLRPFFSSSKSLAEMLVAPEKTSGSDRLSDESSKKADSDSHPETWTDHEHSDPQQAASSPPKSGSGEEMKRLSSSSDKKTKLFTKDKSTSFKDQQRKVAPPPVKEKASVERSNSICQLESSQPRKLLLEQLTKVFPNDDIMPESIILVNTVDSIGQIFAQKLSEKQFRVISTCSSADVRAAIMCLVNKIQKFCNTSSKAPLPIRVGIAGTDSYVNSVIRPYVEQLAGKPPDWLTYVNFLIIPIGVNVLAKYLGSIDSTYHATFLDPIWKDSMEKVESQKTDCQEMVNRTNRFLSSSLSVLNIPIAEAMVTYKEKSSDDESSQIFIPFINDVKIGATDGSASTSVDLEELSTALPSQLSGSPPSSSHLDVKSKDNTTPPSSPNVTTSFPHGSGTPLPTQSPTTPTSQEPLDLQIDYWSVLSKGDSNKKQDAAKSTLKSAFRSMQVTRLSSPGEPASATLTMHYVTKEKKQKIMRLGKRKEKEKDIEPKSQIVEGINRLICLARNHPVKLSIDGIEWHSVKFFQLSAQWQTHVKHFPVALFASPDSIS